MRIETMTILIEHYKTHTINYNTQSMMFIISGYEDEYSTQKQARKAIDKMAKEKRKIEPVEFISLFPDGKYTILNIVDIRADDRFVIMMGGERQQLPALDERNKYLYTEESKEALKEVLKLQSELNEIIEQYKQKKAPYEDIIRSTKTLQEFKKEILK
jgi:hypothetical protein